MTYLIKKLMRYRMRLHVIVGLTLYSVACFSLGKYLYGYYNNEDVIGCQIPILNPFSKDNDELKHTNFDKIVCTGKNWVKCRFSKCGVIPELLKSLGSKINKLECTYRDIVYTYDKDYKYGRPIVLIGSHEYSLKKTDHVKIECNLTQDLSKRLKFMNETSWSGYGVGLKTLKKLRPGKKKNYNVLILGFHAMSRNKFERTMPLSYNYLKDVLGATVLNGYNIIGGDTLAASVPILTGKTDKELLESQYRIWSQIKHVEFQHFLFHKLRNYGYRTAYFEDSPEMESFQYHNNENRCLPADHYLYPFHLDDSKISQKRTERYCVGDTLRFELMMDITDQFLLLGGKKFVFTFISDIPHKDNKLSDADVSMLEFLKPLFNDGILKNTLLLIMGDRGPRFENTESIHPAGLEERLPFLAIRLPEDLTTNRPDALNNLRHNTGSLVTPHDIHATIVDVLDLWEHWNRFVVQGSEFYRGLTLLDLIPKRRTCSDAAIDPHWCTCSNMDLVKHKVKNPQKPATQETGLRKSFAVLHYPKLKSNPRTLSPKGQHSYVHIGDLNTIAMDK